MSIHVSRKVHSWRLQSATSCYVRRWVDREWVTQILNKVFEFATLKGIDRLVQNPVVRHRAVSVHVPLGARLTD